MDRAALDFAISRGIPYTGWCPGGGWAEDFAVPPGVLVKYPHLKETPSSKPQQRTAWNVRDSHATLVMVQGNDLGFSPGTRFTVQCATLIFLRPCFVADVTSPNAVQNARDWLDHLVLAVNGDDPLDLNVAGPRESEWTGAYAAASEFLPKIIG